jgi:hypothetical protein
MNAGFGGARRANIAMEMPAAALRDIEGAMLFVSHDRRFYSCRSTPSS